MICVGVHICQSVCLLMPTLCLPLKSTMFSGWSAGMNMESLGSSWTSRRQANNFVFRLWLVKRFQRQRPDKLGPGSLWMSHHLVRLVSLCHNLKIISSKEISQGKMGKKSRQPKGQMKIRGKLYTRAHRLAPRNFTKASLSREPAALCTLSPAYLGRHDTCWWFWSTAHRAIRDTELLLLSVKSACFASKRRTDVTNSSGCEREWLTPTRGWIQGHEFWSHVVPPRLFPVMWLHCIDGEIQMTKWKRDSARKMTVTAPDLYSLSLQPYSFIRVFLGSVQLLCWNRFQCI